MAYHDASMLRTYSENIEEIFYDDSIGEGLISGFGYCCHVSIFGSYSYFF